MLPSVFWLIQKPPKHRNLRAATHNLRCCVFGLEYPLVAGVFQDGNKVTPPKTQWHDMSCDTMEEILHQLRLVVSCSSISFIQSLKHPGQNMPNNLNHHPVSMIGSFRTWDFLVGNVVLPTSGAKTYRFTGCKIVLRKFRNLHRFNYNLLGFLVI